MTAQTSSAYRFPRTVDTARAWLATGRRQAMVALAVYLAFSIGYFGLHVLPHLASATVGLQDWTDPTANVWSLAWWPYALLHGVNPLVTHALFVPNQINLAANSSTLAPLAGIIAMPITIAFGPIVSYNVLMLASPVLAAFFAFLLCRYVTGNFVASLLGGYVFGFSTYMLGHLEGHLQLVLIFPIPAMVLLVVRSIDGRIGQRRFIVWMALLLVALFLVESELALTFVGLGAVAIALAFVLAPDERAGIVRTVKRILVAGAAALVIVSPDLYYTLRGTLRFGPAAGVFDGGDLLGFLVPPDLVWLGKTRITQLTALAASTGYSGSDADTVSYVGLPLALIVARYTITRWGVTLTRVLFWILAVVVVLVLGSYLHIAGYQTFALPWKLLDRGLLTDVIPLRLTVYVFLILAVILALWLAQPRTGIWRLAKWALAAASIACLIPNIGYGYGLWAGWSYNPRFFTTTQYQRYIARGENVLILPFGQIGEGMLWQADTGMWFRMAGGYISPQYPVDYSTDPLWPALLSVAGMKVDPQELRAFIERKHVGAVVVLPEDAQQWPQALAALGLKKQSLGGVWLYRVDWRKTPK